MHALTFQTRDQERDCPVVLDPDLLGLQRLRIAFDDRVSHAARISGQIVGDVLTLRNLDHTVGAQRKSLLGDACLNNIVNFFGEDGSHYFDVRRIVDLVELAE